jgi:hypothetical protein
MLDFPPKVLYLGLFKDNWDIYHFSEAGFSQKQAKEMKLKLLFSLFVVSPHITLLSLGNNIYMAKFTLVKHMLLFVLFIVDRAIFQLSGDCQDIEINTINMLPLLITLPSFFSQKHHLFSQIKKNIRFFIWCKVFQKIS